MVLETERLYLREMTIDDFEDLKKVLSDPESMKFYPKPFTDEEVNRWINWNIDNYEKYGHGLWGVIIKEENVFIGDCGITMQDIGGEILPEIGFHIIKNYCNNGYATEVASACIKYAFNNLQYQEVYSYSTVENIPSQKVAKKIGMKLYKKFVNNNGKQISHIAVKK